MHTTPAVLRQMTVKDLSIDIRHGKQSLWVTVRWPSGGGVLLRTAYCPEGCFEIDHVEEGSGRFQVLLTTAIGRFRVCLEVLDVEKTLIHWTVYITPDGELNFPFWPVDIYPIDASFDPLGARGTVHAAQRGPATGFIYMTVTEPKCGSLLYLQNLTSLNEYCELTHTTPDTRVGGSWPELGYTPPIAERKPIPKGREIVLSDAYVRFTHTIPEDSGQVSLSFLDMLAEIYSFIPKPCATYQHWLEMAEKAVVDLRESEGCASWWHAKRYLSAYVGTGKRRPESLVQLVVLLPLIEYADWTGEHLQLIDEIMATIPTFYDERIGCIVRYPRGSEDEVNEDADEKNYWEMDSWYLYHPLVNLGRLALRGDEQARKLLMDSLDYAIRVAQHFNYHWPVIFHGQTFEVIRQAETRELGETDVAGLYAYLMLQVHDLTGDPRYLDEAKRAVESLRGLHFNMGYQFNNTAWAANALARLWKETGDGSYLDLSYTCLASVMQNSALWNCDYGYAKHYSTFFAITPLREGNYFALYEESEIFAAFHEYLSYTDGRIPESVRLLLTEFSKYCLDGKYCFYPGNLPEEAVSKQPKNGYVDPHLAVPLEDVYQGWEQAGQVGQEVYGAGAAPAFVVRGYHHIEDQPFLLWVQYPIYDVRMDPRSGYVTFGVRGVSSMGCAMRVIPKPGKHLPRFTVRLAAAGADEERTGLLTEEGHLEFYIVGDSRVTVQWQA